jgi:hypothetical protein
MCIYELFCSNLSVGLIRWSLIFIFFNFHFVEIVHNTRVTSLINSTLWQNFLIFFWAPHCYTLPITSYHVNEKTHVNGEGKRWANNKMEVVITKGNK